MDLSQLKGHSASGWDLSQLKGHSASVWCLVRRFVRGLELIGRQKVIANKTISRGMISCLCVCVDVWLCVCMWEYVCVYILEQNCNLMFWLSPCWPQIHTCMSCNTRTASRYVRIITNTCCVRFIIYVVRRPFRQFKSSDDKFVGGQMLSRILSDWKGCKSVSFWIWWIYLLLLPAANSSVADCSGVCAY